MPAQVVPPRPVELDDASATDDAVDDARADKIRPRATERASHPDDADDFPYLFPLSIAEARTVGEVQPVVLGS